MMMMNDFVPWICQVPLWGLQLRLRTPYYRMCLREKFASWSCTRTGGGVVAGYSQTKPPVGNSCNGIKNWTKAQPPCHWGGSFGLILQPPKVHSAGFLACSWETGVISCKGQIFHWREAWIIHLDLIGCGCCGWFLFPKETGSVLFVCAAHLHIASLFGS